MIEGSGWLMVNCAGLNWTGLVGINSIKRSQRIECLACPCFMSETETMT